MDMYSVKVKIMDEIANATGLLSPRSQHVFGNWHISVWDKQHFPIVTVRMSGRLQPVWSRKPPTVAFGEIYQYEFSLFVWGRDMTEARGIGDSIIDYFLQHNKFASHKIIDVTGFTSKESPLETVRKYKRMIVTFVVWTEEALT